MIVIDECHSTGFMGPTGVGTPEIFGVTKDIDLITGTFGKALGGASGGYTTGKREIIELLRQKSRTYLFSNSLAPVIVGSTQRAFELIKERPEIRERIKGNTTLFRETLNTAGFKILGHPECPIVPVFTGDAKLAGLMAEELFKENIYVIGFSYPVVPKGGARIRVQISAAHTTEQVKTAAEAFIKIGKKLEVIK
jgi:glycine C-acetyltransferase